jgi:predicted nuclease of predicted toxin-antitoxin system
LNFLADENVDRPVVERLRLDGYSVLYVADLYPGVSNGEVMEVANRTNSILLTADRDFGELVFQQQLVNLGVLLIRLVGLSPIRKAEVIAIAIRDHSSELLGAFTVITAGTIRIRRRIV